MASATHYQEFDIHSLCYGNEVMTNKNTGAKSIYVSTQKGSNDPAHKIRFQLGKYEAGDIMRAPFGVSKPLPGQDPNSNRRDLDLSIDSDEMLDFLRRLDEHNLEAAVTHSMDWFKKPLEKAVLRDRFKPIVKEPAKVEYRPTARTKLNVDTERNSTQIFMVTKETPPRADGTPGCIDEYVSATINDIQRGSKVMPIVESNGLWLGANQFGMSLLVTHLLVWPTRQSRGIDAFAGLGAPKCVPGDNNAIRHTGGAVEYGINSGGVGGMYGDAVDDDMLDVS